MAAFSRKYSDEQREAVALAYLNRRIRPASKVTRHAAAGQLVDGAGNRVGPFDVPENSVRTIARDERRARLGERSTSLQDVPHRDAIEQLRRRLIALADYELDCLERQQAKPNGGQVNMERVRQVARTIREAAALPGLSDAPPPAPGAKRGGQRNGGATRGGLAAKLLSEHRKTSGRSVEDLPELDLPDLDVPEVPARSELDGNDPPWLRVTSRRAVAEGFGHSPAGDLE